MSFNKFTWVDRASEYPNRRIITDTSTGTSQLVTITRNEGTTAEQGTPFNATSMNSLEDRIDEMFPVSVADGGTGATTASGARVNLEVMKAYTLYENSSGTQSDITLSNSSANYEYIEIYFKDNDNCYGFSKIYSPNGKKVLLSTAKTSVSGSTGWIKTLQVTIIGSTITSFTCTGELTINNGSSSSTSNVARIWICKVVGLK